MLNDHPVYATIATADLARARSFYEGTLGFSAELTGKGVTFEQYDLPGLKTDERGIAETGPFKGAWFKDPDGNILNVGQGPTS